MDSNEAASLLQRKQQHYGSDRMRLEIRRGIPGLLFSEVDGRSASVSTPGSGWVSLELDDGFSRDHFQDEISDDDLDDIIEEFIRLGMHYLDHGGVTIPSAVRGFERMAVTLPDDQVVLSRSLVRSLRIFFCARRASGRHRARWNAQHFNAGGDEAPVASETQLAIARIMSSGAIGVARRHSPNPFYIWFYLLEPIHPGEVAVEVTFNPENVVIGDIETDVLVHWGTPAEVAAWLQQLLSDVPVELCPADDELRLREILFSEGSQQVERIDSVRPWAIG